jgi:hypothetical protein
MARSGGAGEVLRSKRTIRSTGTPYRAATCSSVASQAYAAGRVGTAIDSGVGLM